MKTGLFFGSFNPIHNGHIAIAGYILELSDLEEIWFVVSPLNPLKDMIDLAPDVDRLDMVRLALEEYRPKLSICDVEMSMPRPSYTIDTLNYLKEKYGNRNFAVIMGADSYESIKLWKKYKELLSNYRIMVYPRIGSKTDTIEAKHGIEIIEAPMIEISSTFIRDSIRKMVNVSYFMPSKAYSYLVKKKLYNSKQSAENNE